MLNMSCWLSPVILAPEKLGWEAHESRPAWIVPGSLSYIRRLKKKKVKKSSVNVSWDDDSKQKYQTRSKPVKEPNLDQCHDP